MAHRLIRLLALWCALVMAPAWGEGGVQLILSEPGGAYQDLLDAFRSTLGGRKPMRVWNLSDLGADQILAMSRGDDLLVPVGAKAARFLADYHAGRAPVLSLLLPRSSVEHLRWPAGLGKGRMSAVYIDQPPGRILNLIKTALPAASRVGMLVAEESQATARLMAQEAGRHRLTLLTEFVETAEDVAPALRRLLPQCDVLLLVPDSLVINAGNAQNVLLTTYRHRIPVVGFSQGLAKAGAVASAYSSPAQIGRQGAALALRWLVDGDDLPPTQAATEFSLAFNPRVARALGLALPDEAAARRQLGAQNE